MKKACSVCLTNCLRLHGAVEEDEDANACLFCALRKPKDVENVQADRHPSFLKKITESTMSTFKLPLSFVADHIERLGESVILEGPGKEQWRVELHRSLRSFITFGQGWEQFVADHVLQIGDQLSFSLSEKSYFQVEVYDGFGVQKRSALDATNTSLDQENIKNVELKDLHIVDVAPIARQEEHDKPENATQSAEQLLIDLIQSSGSESRIVSAPGNDVEIAEAARSEDSGRPAMDLAEIDKRGQLLPPHRIDKGKVVSQRRPVSELEKVRALQGAHALELVNPNTLMVMSKGHVYQGFWLVVLRIEERYMLLLSNKHFKEDRSCTAIPKHFAKDWLPSETKELTLVNKSGHKWPVKWLGSQGGLSAGWRRFALDHRLEEHDVCVLELVDKANYTLLVHIFRVLGGPEEDTGLYTPASTPLRICEARTNTRKPSPVSNGHKAHYTPGKGPESVRKPNDKSTWESDSGTKSLKRKFCLLGDDQASGSLAKAKGLGNQDHQNVEKLVDQASVDERAGNGPGNEVALNSALEPRASCDAKSNPTITPQVLRAFRTDLVKLAKDLLIRNGLGNTDPPGALAASADEVHEQISNFADVSMPVGDRHTPPSIEAYERKKDQGQAYKVVHIYKGRNAGNNTEFLAEIEGYTEGSSITTLDRDDDTGFWWIPSDQFEWDMLHCHIE